MKECVVLCFVLFADGPQNAYVTERNATSLGIQASMSQSRITSTVSIREWKAKRCAAPKGTFRAITACENEMDNNIIMDELSSPSIVSVS